MIGASHPLLPHCGAERRSRAKDAEQRHRWDAVQRKFVHGPAGYRREEEDPRPCATAGVRQELRNVTQKKLETSKTHPQCRRELDTAEAIQ